ncbi:MAG: hypothetical protein JKX81_05195 [Arenicella sp.]|nr:hypothetical protein [Arenicella sp.]
MLYQQKIKLIHLGLYSPSKLVASSGFVAVKPQLASQQLQDGCTLTLSSGSRIEFVGALDNKTIRTIIRSAGLKR